MPAFTLKWTNRAQADQDWIIFPVGDDFLLRPDYSRSANVTHNASYTYQISVSTANSFAAASLTYTAGANTWALQSMTPNEFALQVTGSTVRVACLLNPVPLAAGEETAYQAESPAPPAETALAPAGLLSLFATGARDRQILAAAGPRRSLIASPAVNYDQKPWGLLYGALSAGLGVDPSNFQLTYPFTSWDWPTEQVGFIGGAQYDFCSTLPQWSAIGAYVSGGDRLHQAYQEFLNVIPAATDDATLRLRIEQAGNDVTLASNNYTTVYNQALSTYTDSVTGNVPDFTTWLGTPAGRGWQTQITTAAVRLDQVQKDYNALVDQANTPGLADAQLQFKNMDFYSKLNDPGLATFPRVPNYAISQNARQWVDRIQAGDGPAGGTISFNNRDQDYNFSETWAGGTATVRQLFWQVQVSGEWKDITEFAMDQQLNVSIEFAAIDTISIQPSDWFNASVVKSLANGPFKRGYSAYGGNGTQAIFGESGFFGLMKTSMIVGYKPTFTITTSQSVFDAFSRSFAVATGLRIGPFTFSAAGGSTQAGWNASQAGNSFTGTSTSEAPLIIGVNVAQIPAPPAGALEAGRLVDPMGVCYRFSDCRGDVLDGNCSRSACYNYLGGQSWRKHGAPRCWEK